MLGPSPLSPIAPAASFLHPLQPRYAPLCPVPAPLQLAEAQKNLLRTHTTAVSSRMLYKLAQGGFRPAKYFSIDRVFRNEAVDRTHLAEFHQIEGLICDRGLTLGHLIGVLNEFFRRLGMSRIKFKPAYNPYTEPSMEIFSYSEELGKWMEVGNSGEGCYWPPPPLLMTGSGGLETASGANEACLPRRRYLPARDAAADGAARGCHRHRLGPVPGAADHDPVWDRQHPGPLRPQGVALHGQEEPYLQAGDVTCMLGGSSSKKTEYTA